MVDVFVFGGWDVAEIAVRLDPLLPSWLVRDTDVAFSGLRIQRVANGGLMEPHRALLVADNPLGRD